MSEDPLAKFQLSRIDHQTIRHQVYDTYDVLYRSILDREVAPGTYWDLGTLASQLCVSRAVVSCALLQLTKDNLVDREPRGGFRVFAPSATDIEDLADLVAVFDMLVYRRVATRMTEKDELELREILAAARCAVDERRTADAVTLNSGFHTLTRIIAESRILAEALEPYEARINWLNRQIRDPEHTLEEHQQIFDAMVARDIPRLDRLAVQHVDRMLLCALESAENV